MFFKNLFRKKNKTLLFTTPSHSRKLFIFHKFKQFYNYDISETDTHKPQEALTFAQKKASEIYNTKQTLFLTNGSTSGIITAVLATVKKEEEVLIWKNSHPCHKNAVELAGGIPVFYEIPINPDFDVPDKIDLTELENKFKTHNIKTLIITSPTYEGIVSDIRAIKELCNKYNSYLITDEAHGALYPFSDELPESAIRYSDITVQSLHKTAGGLNPTALLHSNLDFNISNYLNKINTTSPSYPLIATIEANINYLNSQKGRQKIKQLITNIKKLRENTPNFQFFGDDITKILIKKENLTGEELASILYEKFGIEDEKTNSKSTMLLCGLGTTPDKLKKLTRVLSKFS